MKNVSCHPGIRCRAFSVFALLASISIAVGPVRADEHFFVLPDGQRIRLIKSTTELGVLLRDEVDVKAVRSRFRTAVAGELRDVKAKPENRMKLLEVPETTEARRQIVRKDPAVEKVSTVFRYEGVAVPVFSTGTAVAKLRAPLGAQERETLWAGYGLAEQEQMRRLREVYVLRPIQADGDEVLLAQELAGDERMLWAHPNFSQLLEKRQVVPDEFFDNQWHLLNTGQTGGTPGADIDVLGAWQLGVTGEGIRFSMFDDAVDVGHEDLRVNYIGVGQDPALPSGAPGHSDPSPKLPGDFHGTNVMGLAVAAANNVGVRGVAFDAEFTATRGLSDFVTLSGIAGSYIFALEQDVHVHNNSWGFFGDVPDPPVIVDAIDTAFREGRDLDGPGGNPPLGMVILFASGNEGRQTRAGFALSALPQVIGVGASNHDDRRSSFSNYDTKLEFLAPGEQITTTDNRDELIGRGINIGGTQVLPGTTFPIGTDIDPSGNYTGFFSGTSAACPISAGVAGLVLSANPFLTATQVRVIMEHTADRVSPGEARYNGVTGRSLRYGHGRVNARRAVEASLAAAQNGNRTWPDSPKNINVVGTVLRWMPGEGTDEFLVVGKSGGLFDFLPEDGECYSASQAGCGSAELADLPDDELRILFVGCTNGNCDVETEQTFQFVPPPTGREFLAVYGRNSDGLYSFGAGIDSAGGTGFGSVGTTGPDPTRPPALTISASPLQGTSPLTVRFNGNAVSDFPIDATRTVWAFDADNFRVDATTPAAENTYVVPPGETDTFTAQLTMVDITGTSGAASVQIRVQGPETGIPTGAPIPEDDVRVVISRSGAPGTDITSGQSPLRVVMNVEMGTVSGTVQSVLWDLGDGTIINSLMATHTYVNSSSQPQTFAVVATVNILTPQGATVQRTAQRFITIQPGPPTAPTVEQPIPGTTPQGPGGVVNPCGMLGMLPLPVLLGTLLWMKRRRGC